MHTDEERLNWITEQIIGCAFRVANVLGFGFAEKVYENAMAHELRKLGLKFHQQWPIAVKYDGIIVGDYIADLLVEEWVLVELKSVRAIDDSHAAQCLNYLMFELPCRDKNRDLSSDQLRKASRSQTLANVTSFFIFYLCASVFICG